MRAHEREDILYNEGKRIKIEKEEMIMFDYLNKYAPGESNILDIGCGTGEISSIIKSMGHNTKGLDFSKAAIKIASKKGINCEIRDLDQGTLEAKESYDVVWAGDVIEHVFDPINLIKDINRVLKSDGLFLLTVPYDVNLVNRMRVLFGHSYQEETYKKLQQCKHHTFFSKHLIKYMLHNANFRIKEIQYVLRIPKTKRTYVIKNGSLNLFAHIMVITAEKI